MYIIMNNNNNFIVFTFWQTHFVYFNSQVSKYPNKQSAN